MLARIFRPSRSATQSGRAKTQQWELHFAPAAARELDPLMGWTETVDTNGQVRLVFGTREEAIAYAKRRGIPFELLPDRDSVRVPKAYADNFSFRRKQPWTH